MRTRRARRRRILRCFKRECALAKWRKNLFASMSNPGFHARNIVSNVYAEWVRR